MAPKAYNDDSIRTTKQLEHVRIRPTKYVIDRAQRGQNHAHKEIVDNSNDELLNMGSNGLLQIILCKDPKRSTYQVIITDNGRGIPLGKMYPAFTELNTSGKFDQEAYAVSSGSFGVGAKAAAGTSNLFRAISRRGSEGCGDILIKNGVCPPGLTLTSDSGKYATGVTVVYEPDAEIFSEIMEYANGGYNELLDLLYKFSLFVPYQIDFRIYQLPLKKSIWTCPTDEVNGAIDHIVNNSTALYNNFRDTPDRDEYLKKYFNILRPWAWAMELHKDLNLVGNKAPKDADKLGFALHMYGVKCEQKGGRLCLINTVPIDGLDSSHTQQLQNSLKEHMAKFITEDDKLNYFIEHYRVPIFYAMNISFSGAEFTGTTKHAFRNNDFARIFGAELDKMFTTPESVAKITELFELVKDDIEAKYLHFTTGGKAKNINGKKLILNLNFPKKFSDCSTSDRSIAELFISEGASASSREGRDSVTQATYALRGKLFNAVIDAAHSRSSMVALSGNQIFQDIIAILGLTPNMTDFSTLRYGKVFIMTDADSHGKHITNILSGDFAVYNPAFLESGILHVVTPPFYALKPKSSKFKDLIYIRDDAELLYKLVNQVYYEAFEIKIFSKNVFDSGQVLDRSSYLGFAKMVKSVGEKLTILGSELNTRAEFLERFAYVTHFLTPGTMNIEYIREIFGNKDIFYDPMNNILTMSYGRDDYRVSLTGIADALYREVLPLMQEYMCKAYFPAITTKKAEAPVKFKDHPVSIMELYRVFEKLDEMFTFERYKGLGSMRSEARAKTCMNPKHRHTYQITTVGDLDRVYQLMGKDSRYRKELLQTDSVII